jgi:hypothetical protein
MKIFKYISVCAGMLLASSCVNFDSLLDNPNNPLLDQGNLDLYLNSVEINASNVFSALSDNGAELTRIEQMGGASTYANAYGPTNFNGVWRNAYAGVIKNADATIANGNARRFYNHVGIAQALKAYTLMAMVDQFGDIPATEANLGTANLNPNITAGRAVYDRAIVLLDSAIINLGRLSTAATPAPANDLYYAGNKVRWITFAKTMKLKAFMTTRLTDTGAAAKVKALLDENDLIDTEAEDFQARFGTKEVNPDSRHPKYALCYRASGGAQTYIGTYYLFAVGTEKPTSAFDVRRRFYFYRQTLATPGNQDQQSCAFQSKPAHFDETDPFCYMSGGYWGRDHGDASGIPPDGALRTVWGVYPAGGRMDVNAGGAASIGQGGKGAGIFPIWMSFFTEFLKAEAYLKLGIAGDAKAAMEAGVTKSINKVLGFPAVVGVAVPAANVPTTTQVTNYINFVKKQYDDAASDDAKLGVVMKEYYLSAFGNGIEPYNNYRRTGYPNKLQPTFVANAAGTFIRSFFYPSDHITLNTNAKQKATMTQRVFWDTQNPNLR